jgi:hypothetical protein
MATNDYVGNHLWKTFDSLVVHVGYFGMIPSVSMIFLLRFCLGRLLPIHRLRTVTCPFQLEEAI